ncbi:MAG TPA: rhomboid family intramembrane serine protease [Thermoleophilaceae bacterium]|nr:rhomboid family intramembrane serine protease [Thermoleophilaceae bacterium]
MAEELSPTRERRQGGITLLLAIVAVMWGAEIVDTIANHRLDQYGIEPRDSDGLSGIIAAPFLHAGFGHLVGNTIPLLALGFLIALGGAVRVVAVTVIVALVSGVGTWIIGPDNTNHIGASGVVFGYATYLLSRGLFNRNLIEIGLGVAIGALFGGALLAGLEPQEGISWQGHLFGAVGGIVAARMLAPKSEDEPSRIPS